MAVPNPTCPSFTTWRGVSARRSARQLQDAQPPVFVPKLNIYVPADLQDVIKPRVREYTPEDLDAAIAAINDSDGREWLPATTAVRMALSKEKSPPIQSVVDSGVLPRLVTFMGADQAPELQLQAAWALCNVASGNTQQCAAVVGAGAVPAAVAHVRSSSEDMREQVVWLLGNIAGDCAASRDACVNADMLPPLLAAIKVEKNLKVLRQQAWLCSNVLRWKPRHKGPVLLLAPTLLSMAVTTTDETVLTDVFWSLHYAADGAADEMAAADLAAVSAAAAVAAAIANDGSKGKPLVSPALKFLSGLCSGNRKPTQAVVDSGALTGGYQHLLRTSTQDTHLQEVCFALSNVAAGGDAQAQTVIDAGLLPLLVDLIRRTTHPNPRREAVWVISNLTDHADSAQSVWEAGGCRVLAEFVEKVAGSGDPRDAKPGKAAMNGLVNLAKFIKRSGSRGGGGDEAGNAAAVEAFVEEGVYDALDRAVQGDLPSSVSLAVEELLELYPRP